MRHLAIQLLVVTLFCVVAQAATKGSISGTVVDRTSGAPVRNAQVALVVAGTSAGRLQRVVQQVRTDKDGTFDITDLPLATYQVLANFTFRPAGISSRAKDVRVTLTERSPDQRITIQVDGSARP